MYFYLSRNCLLLRLQYFNPINKTGHKPTSAHCGPVFKIVTVLEQLSTFQKKSEQKHMKMTFLVQPFTISMSTVYLHAYRVQVRMPSNRSQMTSKCGKNKKWHTSRSVSATQMFFPYFDVICDLHVLLNGRTATWILFVLFYMKKTTASVRTPIHHK